MFTTENVKKSLVLFHDKIEQNKDYLSELDQAIGDGDHGNNMSRGMHAVMQAIQQQDLQSVSEIFKIVAMNLIGKVGGASGPLYGTAFMEMSKKANNNNDGGNILLAGVEGIKNRGKSTVGEKTMIDVWTPAIEALKEQKLNNDLLLQAVENTKEMEAKKGRASYLGERSIGHIDPGAMSSYYLFASFLEAGVFGE